MTQYVLGFVFDKTGDYVLLMKKSKPEWQKGRWNGIGGKIEDGESDTAAMIREAKEEVGLEGVEWDRYAVLKGPDYSVSVFRTFIPIEELQQLRAQEEDPIAIDATRSLPTWSMITNLRWLIPLAMDSGPHFVECTYV